MKVTVDVDNETLDKLINNEINSLPKETITDIVTEAIRSYMNEGKTLERLCFYDSYNYKKEMTGFLTKVLDTNRMSEKFDDIRDLIVKYVKDNHRDIILEVLITSFARNFVTDEFRASIINALRGCRDFGGIFEK